MLSLAGHPGEDASMTTAIETHGACDSRFNAVKDAFAENFPTHGEVGAAVAVMVDGEIVVDLWAGHADAARTRPWECDTIVNVYSTTKGMTAICAHRLVDQGLLDLDAPVAKYWPEFAQAGKEKLPVRYLLSHRAGLPAVKDALPPGSIFKWDFMTEALAKQEPWWEPGTKHGYHAVTFGWLVGEVVRRITGKSLGTYFREEVAEPLGLDFHIGLAEEHDARTGEMILPPPPAEGEPNLLMEIISKPMGLRAFVISPDMMNMSGVNTREWRAAEIPSGNGHGNARALARVYGALARGGELDGVRVLSQEAIDRAIVEQSNGPDAVLAGLPSRFGLGFILTMPDAPLGPNPRAFGHAGMGGSLGFADPDAKVGFGYAMNKMIATPDLIDPRWSSMIAAVYASL
jgi:CubicO group peptidase (beta-lactamase class C family)